MKGAASIVGCEVSGLKEAIYQDNPYRLTTISTCVQIKT